MFPHQYHPPAPHTVNGVQVSKWMGGTRNRRSPPSTHPLELLSLQVSPSLCCAHADTTSRPRQVSRRPRKATSEGEHSDESKLRLLLNAMNLAASSFGCIEPHCTRPHHCRQQHTNTIIVHETDSLNVRPDPFE